MREQFTVVALPHSCADDAEFHVSLFVSPDLEATDPDTTLASSELFLHWTRRLADARFVLEDQNGEIECAPLLGKVEDGLWEEVFPEDTPVAGYVAPVWTDRPWRTFHPGATTGIAKLVNLLAVLTNGIEPPTVRELPWFGKEIIEYLESDRRHRINPLDWVGQTEAGLTRTLDELTNTNVPLGEFGHPREYFADREPPQGFPGGAALGQAMIQLHRARRFYSDADDEAEYVDQYAERPEPGNPGPPDPPKQIPDFHARVSLVNDHGPLQRMLGLVVDLRADTARLLKSEWLLGRILIDGNPEYTTVVRTACRAVGTALVTRAEDESQWINGRLPIGNADGFDVLDLDPDGAALKTEQYLSTVLRNTAAALQGAPVNLAPPALRSTGIGVARRHNAATTASAMGRQGSLLDGVRNQPPGLPASHAPLLTTEDVMQGVRVEVHDGTTGVWRSLHQVRVRAEVVDGRTLEFEDVAFLQETTASSGTKPKAPIRVHESVFGWDGWSLSAARPALPVVSENGVERVETDPRPPDDPSTPVLIDRKAAPGSLPRLRFGRGYSFRAWGVDLACNSRPHRLGVTARQIAPPDGPEAGGPGAGGPAAVAAQAEARPTADFGALTSFTAGSLARIREAAEAEPAASAPPVLEFRPDVGITLEAGVTFQEVATVLPQVLGRLELRRGELRPEPVSDLGAVRATLASELATDNLTPAFTARLDPAVVASGLDLPPGVRVLPAEQAAVTAEVPYVRWQPLPPPAIVPKRPYTEGESNEVLVIRSGVTQDPVTLEVAPPTPPDQYAAEHPGRDATCERHLVPPKTSQLEAEQHGAFDAAIGSSDPSVQNLWLAAAIRESGTLYDLDVPRLDNPAIREPQDGVELVHGPGAVAGELATLPIPPGEAPGPGQYVIHDTLRVHTPYLPDVAAHGVGFVFPDAGREFAIVPPFGVEGFTARYEGTWPEIDGYRLALGGADELGGSVSPHLIELFLPPGTRLRARLSSALKLDDLPLLGPWGQLPELLRTWPGIPEAAANGWLWSLTPAERLTFVHAVPRPISAPDPFALVVARTAGATNAMLVAGVEVHGPSTESLTVEARWHEVIDDLSLPAWHTLANQRQVACQTLVEPWEDVVVLMGHHPDKTYDDPVVGHLRSHQAIHEFGDTLHRLVHYRLRATTRFREYFSPDELAPLPAAEDDPALPIDDGRSTVSPEITLHVPNTSLPAPPLVHSVLPLFRWEEETEPEQPLARRRTRRSGVRVYLERPWFTTGADEQIGVVLAIGDRPERAPVSQWGNDPFWLGGTVADREALQLTQFLSAAGWDDYESIAGPSGKPEQLPSADDPAAKVWVVPYRPQYNEDRRLWYVDIGFPAKFWPFVQLALVRYQPHSIAGRHVSKAVVCDYVQIVPERAASVSRTREGRVRVRVSGPAGVHDLEAGPNIQGAAVAPRGALDHAIVGANRVLRAKLQRRRPGSTSDLGWDTLATTDLAVRSFGPTLDQVVWIGELDVPESLPFTRPTTAGSHRVRVEEWETFAGDRADLGNPRSAPTRENRLVYADEFELGDPADPTG